MRRLLHSINGMILLGCAGAGNPGPTAPIAGPPELAYSRWRYEDLGGGDEEAYEFDADGSIFLPDGNNATRDTWQFDGQRLTMSVNDFVAHEGRLTANGAFVGAAKNKEGKSWEWVLLPDLAPAEDGCADAVAGFDITDTQWKVYVDGASHAKDTAIFLQGGRYSYHDDPYNTNNTAADTWSQAGQDVKWSVNEYATYTGHLVGDHTIVATVSNVKGESWRARLLRQPVPGECR